MFIAYIIIAPVLALLLLVSAAFKLRPDPRVREIVGVPRRFFPHLAALDKAGVANQEIILPGTRHSRAYSDDVWNQTVAFLENYLKK